jgi:hypothetical protein
MAGGLVALSAVHDYDYFTRKLIEEYSTNLAAVYQAACSRRLGAFLSSTIVLNQLL